MGSIEAMSREGVGLTTLGSSLVGAKPTNHDTAHSFESNAETCQ